MDDPNSRYTGGLAFRAHPRRIADIAAEFFRLEAAGGIVLILFSALALIVANSPLYPVYEHFFNGTQFRIGFSGPEGLDFELRKNVLHWINDGLMAVFFLLVGLEIKREMMVGELASRARALLPVIAAIGGMIVPAVIYYFISRGNHTALRGWAIPCATDIAFALCILSLLGSRIPSSIKALLTAIAIIDDLGAILIIALFYTEKLEMVALLYGLLPLAGLFLLNYLGIARRAPYILLGAILWILVLKSGVHATMAGVITALFIPLRVPDERRSPAQRLENDLHPWVAFLILPLFGFANAGVPFGGMNLSSLANPVTLGIIAGLFAGKQLGVFGMIWLAVKSGLCPKPEEAGWRHLYGVSVLCGIGFTMSLFIGGLAFEGGELQAELRLGVIGGSVLSALAAYILLRAGSRGRKSFEL